MLLLKAHTAVRMFTELIAYHFINELSSFAKENQFKNFEDLKSGFSTDIDLGNWLNIGGQIMPELAVQTLIDDVKKEKMNSWEDVHLFYKDHSELYGRQKLEHAFAALKRVFEFEVGDLTPALLKQLSDNAVVTRTWITENIKTSRAKDYQNDFRKMVYDNEAQMNEVIGTLEDNIFIREQEEECKTFATNIKRFQETFCV